MTAIAALTLADGAATPVNHTFNPANISADGVAKWEDRSGGIAIGFPVVTQSLRYPTKSNRNYKLTIKVVSPTLEVTSPSTATGIQPAPTKAYDILMVAEILLPERSTLQQRKDAMAFFQNLISNSVVQNAVQNFESVY